MNIRHAVKLWMMVALFLGCLAVGVGGRYHQLKTQNKEQRSDASLSVSDDPWSVGTKRNQVYLVKSIDHVFYEQAVCNGQDEQFKYVTYLPGVMSYYREMLDGELVMVGKLESTNTGIADQNEAVLDLMLQAGFVYTYQLEVTYFFMTGTAMFTSSTGEEIESNFIQPSAKAEVLIINSGSAPCDDGPDT